MIGRNWIAGAAIASSIALAAPARADAPDAWITAKVKTALIADEGVPGTKVRVDTTDGRVTLFGTVATAAEKQRAESVAKGINGAKSVRNLIVLGTAPPRDEAKRADAELMTEVKQALDKDSMLRDADVEVRSVQNGVVYLAGSAKTFSEERRAIGTAAGVLGVRRVESEITAPEEISDAEIARDDAYDEMAYLRSAASDAWITTAAKTRLLADPQTPGLEINVDTQDGVVTLFGSVWDEQTKQRSAEVVKQVNGVRSLENMLQIVPKASEAVVSRVDADLKKEVEERLAARKELDGNDIKVQVENAVVRLTGTIDGSRDRLAALTAARGVTGVTRVIDDLQVDPPKVSSR
jgi:osmotically-inducible protein OsmY